MKNNPISLINTRLPDMSKTEKNISDYILNHYDKVTSLVIKDLAENIGVSESSIIRFTQSLGYSGFREFKLAIAFHPNKNEEDYFFDDLIVEENSLEYILKTYIQGNISNLEENLVALDYKKIEKIAQLILKKDHIFLVGTGYSGNLARNAYIKLKSLLSNIHIAEDSFEVVQDSYLLDENSLIIGISQTGTNTNAITLLENGNNVGATTVALTSGVNNKLYDLADYQIVPTASFRNTGSRYFSTEIIFKIILDSIAVYVESNIPDSNSPFSDYL